MATTYVIRTFGGVLLLRPNTFVVPQNTIKRTLVTVSGKRALTVTSGKRTIKTS